MFSMNDLVRSFGQSIVEPASNSLEETKYLVASKGKSSKLIDVVIIVLCNVRDSILQSIKIDVINSQKMKITINDYTKVVGKVKIIDSEHYLMMTNCITECSYGRGGYLYAERESMMRISRDIFGDFCDKKYMVIYQHKCIIAKVENLHTVICDIALGIEPVLFEVTDELYDINIQCRQN